MQTRGAIVTGGAGGIGAAACRALAARGIGVLVVDRDGAAAEAVAAAIRADGGTAVAHAADVSDEAQVAGYVAAAREHLGSIDGFFNNAGIEGAIGNVEAYPIDVFDQVIAVNLRGVWLGLRHVVPVMREQGRGAIVNTASQAGLRGVPGLSAYVASKHAVVGLSRGVALEVAGTGIRVNCLCPGPMDTRMMDAIHDTVRAAGGDPSGFVERIPVGRYGRPTEAAALVAWLIDEGPEFLTGAELPVDGAMTTP